MLLIGLLIAAAFLLGAALQRRRSRLPSVEPAQPRPTRWLNADVRAIEARLRRVEQEVDELKRRLKSPG
jgi:hypothetical protein